MDVLQISTSVWGITAHLHISGRQVYLIHFCVSISKLFLDVINIYLEH